MQIYLELQGLSLNLRCSWRFDKGLYIIEKATDRYFICIWNQFTEVLFLILK